MKASAETGAKLDLKKELKSLYGAKAGIIVSVNPGAHRFLCADGRGDPNTTPAYRAAVEALFSVSYTLKFALRHARGVDYAVMPLEGLWWSDDMTVFTHNDRARWQWTMMIMQPPFVTAADVAAAQAEVIKRKKAEASLVRLEEFIEGPAAQVLHVGPFTTEGPTIAALHAWIAERGHALAGKHHEIYLSDIRRTPSSRWKTIIRQPFVAQDS